MEDKQKIIIVEDEIITARDIKIMVEKEGYTVPEIVGEAEDVIEAAQKHDPQLCLMDIRLRGQMDGIEAALQLRKQLDIPVVYVTSHADDSTLERAQKTEPLGFLTKPVSEADLRSVLTIASYKQKMEEKLRRSERRFRMIAENVRDGFWISDLNKEKYIYTSPSYSEIWGLSTEQLKENPRAWIEYIHPHYRERIERKILEEQVNGSYDEEFLIVRPDGEQRWIHDRAFPVQSGAGEVERIVGVSEDITSRKELENRARQAEKMAAVGQMSAGLMHEINNPNAFVLGNLNWLNRAWEKLESVLENEDLDSDVADMVLEEMPDVLNAMENGCHRIKGIVDKTKKFARQETSRVNFEPFDPLDALQETINRVEVATDNKNLVERDISADIKDNNYELMGDKDEFEEVFVNLFENAFDALEDEANPEVIISVEKEDDRLVFSVIDNGIGIPEDIKDKIFDPFVTSKPVGQGTGLGLAVVQGILENMDAEIEYNDRQPKGTEFKVYFPLQTT